MESRTVGAAPSPRATVMLVDDDPLLLRGMDRILRAANYEVILCRDGSEALAVLARRPLDAIVTDVAMPGLGGVDLLRAVREYDGDVPVVMATGSPSIQSAVAAVEHGAFKYLMKPVTALELETTIEKAVQLYRLARLRRETLAALESDAGALREGGLQANFDSAIQSLWPTFQPIVRSCDGSLFGYEALVRTDEPAMPHPGALLDAAERLDGLWALGRSMREKAALVMAPTDPGLHLFLNLHPRDLGDPALLDAAAPHCLLASRIVLEVTERAPLLPEQEPRRQLAELRAAGFRIAVDDLGAGYSGLNSFVQLEPEFVKLDMALIRNVDENLVKQRLVRSITSVCRDMGLQVVAEGIETAQERDMVIELGCDLLQGYRFGRPQRDLEPPTW
jgi:EAL domain-containing protein (putative c-di-GMP-specific phosphodiesterase class I)